MNRNRTPEHRNKLQVSWKSVMNDRIPVVRPADLRSVTVPVFDVFGSGVIDETAFGSPCCHKDGARRCWAWLNATFRCN